MLLPLLYGGFVGLSLGLTGGGGSLFAIPLLVYGLGLDFRRAVAVSLAVVALTALYGATLQARKGMVRWRAGAFLGIGGIFTAPIGGFLGAFLPDRVSILLFTALMVLIGFPMIRNSKSSTKVGLLWLTCQRDTNEMPRMNWNCAGKLLSGGAVTGLLAGVFGVGGGFLLVPVLLLVTAISIESATATSLVAMFLISASGFGANFGNLRANDLELGALFLAGAGFGMTIGTYAKTFLPSHVLKKGFGVMVLVTALYMLFLNL